MNPFYDIVDPETLDYSRGVKIEIQNGKIRFMPKFERHRYEASLFHKCRKCGNIKNSAIHDI